MDILISVIIEQANRCLACQRILNFLEMLEVTVIKTSNVQWFASTITCLWAESVEIFKPSTFPRDTYYMWAHGLNYAEHLGKEYPISPCAPGTQYRCHPARLVWANSDFFSISTKFYIFIFSPFTRGFPGCCFFSGFGPWARALLRQCFRNIIKNYFQPKSNLKPFARTGQPYRPVCNCNATVLSTWGAAHDQIVCPWRAESDLSSAAVMRCISRLVDMTA